MSLIEELKELIHRTGIARDREILEKILIEMQKKSESNWAYSEDVRRIRR